MNDRKLQGAGRIYTSLGYNCCGSLKDFLKVEAFGQKPVESPENGNSLCELQKQLVSSGHGLRRFWREEKSAVEEKLLSWVVDPKDCLGTWILRTVWEHLEGRGPWETQCGPHPLPPIPYKD